MWKSASCEVQGLGHIRCGVPCQDKTAYAESGGIHAIVLADGAGSAKLSHLGAECVAETVSALLAARYREFMECPDGAAVKLEILDEVSARVNEKAGELGCAVSDLASTLLFVAASDSDYILGHIGDGVACCLEGVSLKAASLPNNGEFANETVFVTSGNAASAFYLSKGPLKGIVGFAIMSDGAEASLYHKQTGRLSKSIMRMIGRTYACSKDEMESQLQDAFENVVRQGTQDDCSIAILSRGNIGYELIQDMSHAEKYELFKLRTRPTDPITRKRIRWYSKVLLCVSASPKSADEISLAIKAKKRKTRRFIGALLDIGLIQERDGKYSFIGD